MFKKIKNFLLTNQTIRQTIAKNTFWLTVSNVGGRLLRAVIIIYAARVLGAAGYGAFSYAISFAALLTIFTDLGIGPVLTRETAKARDAGEKAKILSTSLFLKLILLALGVIVIVFVAPLLTSIEEAKPLLSLVAFVLFFDALREFGFSLIRALERMELEAGVYLFTNLAIVLSGFIFLYLSPTPLSFTYAYAIGTGLGAAATAFALRGHLRNLLSSITRTLIKPIFASAWPFAFAGLLGGLMINTDILVIGYFRSAEDVGFYSAADRLIQLLYLFPSIIAASTFPAFARLAHHDNVKSRRLLEQLLTLTFLIAIPLAVGGALTSSSLITLLFGNAYLSAVLPLQILFLTLVIRFPAALLSNAVFAYDRQKLLITFAVLGGITNLVLDLLLIPRFGIAGSAWTTLIAQVISNIYLWKKMNAINPFVALPYLKRIFLASLVMAGVTAGFSLGGAPLAVVIPLSIAVYLGMLALLKEPLLREFKLILRPRA